MPIESTTGRRITGSTPTRHVTARSASSYAAFACGGSAIVAATRSPLPHPRHPDQRDVRAVVRQRAAPVERGSTAAEAIRRASPPRSHGRRQRIRGGVSFRTSRKIQRIGEGAVDRWLAGEVGNSSGPMITHASSRS